MRGWKAKVFPPLCSSGLDISEYSINWIFYQIDYLLTYLLGYVLLLIYCPVLIGDILHLKVEYFCCRVSINGYIQNVRTAEVLGYWFAFALLFGPIAFQSACPSCAAVVVDVFHSLCPESWVKKQRLQGKSPPQVEAGRISRLVSPSALSSFCLGSSRRFTAAAPSEEMRSHARASQPGGRSRSCAADVWRIEQRGASSVAVN